MSGDFIQPLDSSRPEEGYLAGSGGPSPASAGNPLVKGFIVLTMVAVATAALLATRDGDDSTVVAASDIESAPLGPAADDEDDDSTASSSTSGPDGNEAGSESADSWVTPRPAQLSSFSAAEQLRQQVDDDATSTSTGTSSTEGPTTAAAPSTTAPSTTVETTVPESTGTETSASSSETGSTDTTGEVDGSGAAETSTTTAPPETDSSAETTTTAAEDGWVDSGNGVLLPPVLLAIRYCESRDDYQAANPSSSARGAYQFLTGSWAAYGHAERYGVSRAHLASNAQQDEAALITWQRDGTRPWNASKSCWSSRI